MYLDPLANGHTAFLKEDVLTVLTYLFEHCGRVLSKEVENKETDVRAMMFCPAYEMNIFYIPIQQLEKLAFTAKISYTDVQILNIAMMVIWNIRNFEKELQEWSSKSAFPKRRANFNSHSKLAQR